MGLLSGHAHCVLVMCVYARVCVCVMSLGGCTCGTHAGAIKTAHCYLSCRTASGPRRGRGERTAAGELEGAGFNETQFRARAAAAVGEMLALVEAVNALNIRKAAAAAAASY